jgi:glutamate synthase (NADPH/NADH) large chain
MVIWQRLEVPHYVDQLKDLLQEHATATQSPLANRLLLEFDREQERFWQIVPKEMLDKLEVSVTSASATRRA